jgi:predicted Zn-dependent peptidase
MKRSRNDRRWWDSGFGIWALGVVLLALAATAGKPLVAAVTPPKLQYQTLTLPNGLRVILSEDHSTPIAHVAVWYHVGSKNERSGRTGFAHLFEHMMFKGSQNVEPDSHTSLIASVGGRSNAYTTEDETVFWQTVPANYLPIVLWLEADRMATLRIDEEAFKREREVVKEERRMRIENQPYGRLNEIIFDHAFTTHPYKHPVIGSMKDLEAASVDDVREFHRTFYVPANATVTIVGDFDAAQTLQLVNQYFGRVPRGAGPVQRNIPKEPPQKQEKRAVVSESWPLPAVVVGYHVTYDGHPDAYPLHMTAKILSDGNSSRIPRELMYNKRLALTAFGSGNITEDPNLFYAVAVLQPGRTAAEAEKALIDEFEKLKREPVTAGELQRAKNQWARDYILSRETIQQKAMHLAHAAVIHNDIGTADGEFGIFMNVTTADIQRVAKTYFNETNRVVLHVLPKEGGSR